MPSWKKTDETLHIMIWKISIDFKKKKIITHFSYLLAQRINIKKFNLIVEIKNIKCK